MESETDRGRDRGGKGDREGTVRGRRGSMKG